MLADYISAAEHSSTTTAAAQNEDELEMTSCCAAAAATIGACGDFFIFIISQSLIALHNIRGVAIVAEPGEAPRRIAAIAESRAASSYSPNRKS